MLPGLSIAPVPAGPGGTTLQPRLVDGTNEQDKERDTAYEAGIVEGG